jgi:dUTP pyrophosphatase
MSDVVEVKLFKSDAIMPTKATKGSAGYDVYACVSEFTDGVMVHPHNSLVLSTGINVNIPEGYEIQVRPRSGLAVKHGITVLNTPGTVDSDFSGDGEDFEVKVILFNHNKIPFLVKHGDRIAQMVICKLPDVEMMQVEEFTSPNNTNRSGGLGSTGK